MHTHPADPERPGDGSGALPSDPHLTHLLKRHRRLAALIDAFCLYSLDPRLLPLADELALHLGDHAQHGHKDRPRRIVRRTQRTLFARSVLSSGLVLVTVAMTNVGIVRMLVPPAPAVGSLRRHGESATTEGAVQKLRSF